MPYVHLRLDSILELYQTFLNASATCIFSASPMMMTPDLPRREFSSKLRPENCKEVDMLNYLFDCYERVAYEERTAPKVGFII